MKIRRTCSKRFRNALCAWWQFCGILVAMSIAHGSVAFAQMTWHVPKDFPTIQQAIDAADDGDEIIVAPGTYNEAINFLGKAIHLRGSDGPNATTIDGAGLQSSVVTCANNEEPKTIIEGFTITGGSGTIIDGPYPGPVGGGMLLYHASPNVLGCRFIENTTSGPGGGLFITGGSPTIVASEFFGNASFDGGGAIYNNGMSGDELLTIDNCIFIDNFAIFGGAVQTQVGRADICESQFVGNNSFEGGAIFSFAEFSKIRVSNCLFSSNSVNGCFDGCHGAAMSTGGDVEVTDCTFSDNTAEGFGGAMALQYADYYAGEVYISRTTFINNIASMTGGAIDMAWSFIGPVIIEDSTFSGNLANCSGGAINWQNGLFLYTMLEITRCDFVDNGVNEKYGSGGALWLAGIDVVLEDNGFAGNVAAFGEGGVITGATLAVQPPPGGGGPPTEWISTGIHGDGVLGDGLVIDAEITPGDQGIGIAVVKGDLIQSGIFVSQTLPCVMFEYGGQTQSSALNISLGGALAGSEHGQVEVDGTAMLAGALNVSLAEGFIPRLGNDFAVLTAQTIEGVFDFATFPPMPPGLVMRLQYVSGGAEGGDAVVLSVESLAVLLGFGDPNAVALEGAATSVATGDFDGDGHLDIALTLRGESPADDGSVLVLFNDGSGQSFSGQQYPVGREPSAIAIEDFTGNDRLDIAVTNGADNSVTVLLNTLADGETEFVPQPPVQVGIAPSGIVAADLRGIGIIDLAVTNAAENTVHVLQNDGNGGFSFSQSIPVGPNPSAIIAAPLMGTGHIDLAVTNADADPNVPPPGEPQPTLMILGNDGSGSFSVSADLFGGAGAIGLDAEDLDNNKDLDLLSINTESGTLSVFKNLGNGNFGSAVNIPLSGTPRSLASWDMDGNDTADIAIVVDDPDLGRLVRVLRNDTEPGSSTIVFSFEADIAVGDDPILVTSGDVTGDGSEDLITINAGNGAVAGEGQSSVAVYPNQSGAPAIPGDLNGDGVVDEFDLLILLNEWGACASCDNCPGDMNGDCDVNVADLLMLLGLGEWE